jgi:hypothetical protein
VFTEFLTDERLQWGVTFSQVVWLIGCFLQIKGYKDGLQPESLADGELAGETKSTSVEN